MKPYQKEQAKAMTLAEETVSFGGMMLEYRLVAGNDPGNRFSVLISNGNESAACKLGSSIDDALRIFRTVLGGRVTPCTLQEVICDLRRSV